MKARSQYLSIDDRAFFLSDFSLPVFFQVLMAGHCSIFNPDKRDKYLHEIRFKKQETNF